MSEYIVDVGDADELHFAAFQKRAEFCFGYPVREEIVRCKDCELHVKRGRRLYCDLNAGGFPEVEPDGFCKWGERRSHAGDLR